MRSSRKLVSILTPCYNGEKFISQYQQCLVNQTYRPIECIIVNDGSTDGSREMLERMAAQLSSEDLVVRVIHQENTGSALATSVAFSHSKGELVCCWDIDDIFFNENIKILAERLQSSPNIDCVVSNGYFCDENSTDRVISSFDKVEEPPKSKSIFYQLLTGKTWNWAGSYMVRASSLLRVYGKRAIPAPRKWKNSQNLQMLMPASLRGCAYVNVHLMKYVQHSKSTTHSKQNYEVRIFMENAFEDIRLLLLECMHEDSLKNRRILKTTFSARRLYLAYRYKQREDFLREYRILKQEHKITLEQRLIKQDLMRDAPLRLLLLRVLFWLKRILFSR